MIREMLKRWRDIAIAVGGLLGWIATILPFFGIDAKTIAKGMTAHYLLLVSSLVCFAVFIYGCYRIWNSHHVTPENVEEKVKLWIEAFRLRNRSVSNEKIFFGREVSIPPRFIVTIQRQKNHPSYLTFYSNVRLSDTQREQFDSMSEGKKLSVHRTIRLECAKSKVGYHTHKNLEFVVIHKQIPITRDLKEGRLMDTINEMHFAATVVMDTIDGLITPHV